MNIGACPLRLILPPLIHLKPEQRRLNKWLEPTLKMLALEARQPRPVRVSFGGEQHGDDESSEMKKRRLYLPSVLSQ